MEVVPLIVAGKSSTDNDSSRGWQDCFTVMLPKIRRRAEIAFRGSPKERREEDVQESIADAAVAYARLSSQGKADVAVPSALARFAIAQVREGREVGSSQNIRDAMSLCAQSRGEFFVERLDRLDRFSGE
jgi:hypothetical protein